MVRYFLARILDLLVTLVIIVTLVFCVEKLFPSVANPDSEEETVISTEVVEYYKQVAHGDFGRSTALHPKTPVLTYLAEKALYSAGFGLISLAIAYIAGTYIGATMALRKGGPGGFILNGLSIFSLAIPSLIIFALLQAFAADVLALPVLFEKGNIASCIFPILCMSITNTAFISIWVRRYAVNALNSGYVHFAESKGFRKTHIVYKQIIKHAFIPMLQDLPTNILLTVTGSIAVEALYSIPGLGNALISAVKVHDTPVVLVIVCAYAFLSMLGLIIGDMVLAAGSKKNNVLPMRKESL